MCIYSRLLLLAGASALFLLGTAAQAQNEPPRGNAPNGKTLYMKNGCYECHGTAGQGGTGPRLAPPAIDTKVLTAFARKGGAGMPRYSPKVMSDAELADVRAYLATIPAPPPVNSIALLNQ